MDGLGQEKNARVFLDPNQLSTDGTVALGNISFSHDGKYLAYASRVRAATGRSFM